MQEESEGPSLPGKQQLKWGGGVIVVQILREVLLCPKRTHRFRTYAGN